MSFDGECAGFETIFAVEENGGFEVVCFGDGGAGAGFTEDLVYAGFAVGGAALPLEAVLGVRVVAAATRCS